MKSPVKMTVRIALGAILSVLSTMQLRAQTSTAVLPNGSQIIAIVNGTILDKQQGVTSDGVGSATLYDASGKTVAARSSVIYFRDPLQTKLSWWGGEVRATSKGNRSSLNNRGVYSEQTTSPFVWGEGKYTTGGGNLLVRLGPELTGTTAGEVRFQALDAIGVLCDLSNSAASTSLRGGREGFSGGIQWVPPAFQTGITQTYSADLVVELRYGMDGIVDGGQNVALRASRVLDLQVLGNDGVTAVNIRKIAGNPAPPMLSGWTEIDGNTAFLTTSSMATGQRTSEQITWGNGVVAIPPGRTIINSWTSKTVRVPLRLSSARSTSFKITAVSSNASSAHRNRSLGRTSIPAPPTDAPANPRLGNGVEIRIRIERVTLLPGPGGDPVP
jgi:hypothetical protein